MSQPSWGQTPPKRSQVPRPQGRPSRYQPTKNAVHADTPPVSVIGPQDLFEALGHLGTGPEILVLEVIALWPRYVAAQRHSSTG